MLELVFEFEFECFPFRWCEFVRWFELVCVAFRQHRERVRALRASDRPVHVRVHVAQVLSVCVVLRCCRVLRSRCLEFVAFAFELMFEFEFELVCVCSVLELVCLCSVFELVYRYRYVMRAFPCVQPTTTGQQ